MKIEEQEFIDTAIALGTDILVNLKLDQFNFVKLLGIVRPDLQENPSLTAMERTYKFACDQLKIDEMADVSLLEIIGIGLNISMSIGKNEVSITKGITSSQSKRVTITAYHNKSYSDTVVNCDLLCWHNYKIKDAKTVYQGF